MDNSRPSYTEVLFTAGTSNDLKGMKKKYIPEANQEKVPKYLWL